MTALDPAVDSLARARRQFAWTSTAERVADAVREEVVEGRLLPGARVPEQRLCTALGVSCGPAGDGSSPSWCRPNRAPGA